MFKKLLSLVAVVLLTGASLVYAQKTVSGKVTDGGSGLGLPSATVQVKGTNTGTTTSLDGSYSIRVPNNNAILVFSFVGYVNKEETVGDRTTVDVTLNEDPRTMEVVVVGYGVQRKADVTAAVSSVKVDDANLGVVASVDQLMNGRAAGVQVTQNSGDPGGGMTVRVRGGASLSASNEPLYVVDGIPMDTSPTATSNPLRASGTDNATFQARNPMNFLNPNDIESIDILKDASATAIYGARGANGVVLITTKKGKGGTLQTNYDVYVANASVASRLNTLDAAQFKQLRSLLGLAALPANETADTNWQDQIFRSASSMSHNLSFGGGTGSTQYFASLSYLDQQGVVISSGFKRTSGRINVNHKAWDGKLRLGLNMTSSYTEDDNVPSGTADGFRGGMFTNVFQMHPTQPVTNADGTYFEFSRDIRNPVAMANQVADAIKTTRALGNLYAELDIIPGLVGRVSVGANRSQSSRRFFIPKNSPLGSESNGTAIQGNRELTNEVLQGQLTYTPNIGENQNLTVTGVYEYNQYETEEFNGLATGFVTDANGADRLESGSSQQVASYHALNKLISFIGRANYDLNGKYYLQVTSRYDGSSRFGPNNRWAFFPSASVRWRISGEEFLKGNKTISELSLRASYGQSGQERIGDDVWRATLAANNSFVAGLGGNVITGYAATQLANPDLKWETIASTNVGVDFGLLNNKLQGSLEVYQAKTQDLLLLVPQAFGVVSTRFENVGSTENKGVEFNLTGYVIDNKDMSLSITANIGANRNKVIELDGREQLPFSVFVTGAGYSSAPLQVIKVGYPATGTFIGKRFTGFDASGNETYAAAPTTGDTAVGNDLEVIGTAEPDFVYGFSTKFSKGNLDVNLFLRGQVGGYVYNNTAAVYGYPGATLQQGQSGIIPADLTDLTALAKIKSNPGFASSRWLEDASFLRVDNLTVGYRFTNLSKKVRSARVYLTGQNLFLLSGYSGYDPEVAGFGSGGGAGVDYLVYPKPRTVTVGLNLGL